MSSEQITDLIGTSQPRHESLEKVNGTAMYIDDLKFDNCLYGATIRSKKPRGKVTGIKFKDGIPWDEFTIVLPKDIKGDNHVLLIEATQPFLAEYVKHIAEPVALIAHRDKVLLTKAVNFVEVEMDEEPAIFDIEESLEKKNIQYGEDNVFKAYSINSGDVDSAWDECDLVLEDVYRTPAQEQFYIETNGV
ncbi:MAG: molybdopterin-dependent oxidoreductase, partial [Candidatus Lindowbacteria bacterium]|nr:molybdopterin-dependent oxidoreductase [Candidatus Lindowbacteria bacterium]